MLKTPKASNTSTKSRIPRPTTTNKSDCSQKEESTEKPIKKPEKKSQIAKPVKRRNDGIKKAKSPLEEISVSKKITAVVHQALAVNQALATARKTTAKPKLLSYKVANDELPDLQAKQEQDEYSTNDVKYAVLHEDEKPVKVEATPQTTINEAPKLNENIKTEFCLLSASSTQLQTKIQNPIENQGSSKNIISKKKKKNTEKAITEKTEELPESKPSKTKKLTEIKLTEDEETQGSKITSEETPAKKKVKKLTKKIRKSKTNNHDEIFESVETVNNTARTPSTGSQNLAKTSTSILLSPTPWIDRHRSPSPFLTQRPTSRIDNHTNQSTKESSIKTSPLPIKSEEVSRNHTPTYQPRISTPSQQPTSPKPQQPNAGNSVDLEQVLKLFEAKKIPLELSDIIQLLEKSNIPDEAVTDERASCSEVEEVNSSDDLQEFEELEDNMTDPAFDVPPEVDGNEVINETNVSNIIIQINGEDDSKVSEIDSNSGDLEKCENTDSEEKEEIGIEEAGDDDKSNHFEFDVNSNEESLEEDEEDSDTEVGSSELDLEEIQCKTNEKEALEDKNIESEEERLSTNDKKQIKSEILEETETEETDETEAERETEESEDTEDFKDSSEDEKDKCDNENYLCKNESNFESKIDPINCSKENEDKSFSSEDETNTTLDEKLTEKAEVDLQVGIDLKDSKEDKNQDDETKQVWKGTETTLIMIDDNESATDDLKDALESIQEMKEKMAQLMALVSAPNSPAPLQLELEEMIHSIVTTKPIRNSAEVVEIEEPCILHMEDLTIDLSKDSLMKESALKQNEEVVAGVSEDPLLPVFEQRKVFELETMRNMITEAEKCNIDFKVSQESVPLKCPIPVKDDKADKADDTSASKQFSNGGNENVTKITEEKEDSFDSADREVGEIFIEQTIIIENSLLPNHHYFSTIEKTNEHNRQIESNSSKSDLFSETVSPRKLEKILSECNEVGEEVANTDTIADEASNLNFNLEIEGLDMSQTKDELKDEQLECSSLTKEVTGEDSWSNIQEKGRIENKKPVSENLLATDLSKSKSKSSSLEDFEIVKNPEVTNSNEEDLQETQESLSRSEDDQLPNITCRLCKERGTKVGSHSHRKSIEDLISFFDLMTHYKNEHQHEPGSKSEPIGRKSRQSLKLSQFELDLNEKNDQNNQLDNDIKPKEITISPPPRDYLKPVYYYPRPYYPTYSRFNQSHQELVSNNGLRDESRNDNVKQSSESLVYPESLMRCRSESNLKKTLKFSVSMKELDTDMLTISFDGDNVNISSSSKVLTQSSIDVKQQGGETIFNVKANPSTPENAEGLEQLETVNKSSQVKEETHKLKNDEEMEMGKSIQSKDETEKLKDEEEMEIKGLEKEVEKTETVLIANSVKMEPDYESSSVDTVIDNRRKSHSERYDIDIPTAKLFYFDGIDIDKEDGGQTIEMQKKLREPEEVFVEAVEVISSSGSHENIVDLDVSPHRKSLDDDCNDEEDIINEEMDKELDLIATAKIYQYPSNEEIVKTQYHTKERKFKPNSCIDGDEEEELLERSQQYNRFQRAPIRPGRRHRKFDPILSSPQVLRDI